MPKNDPYYIHITYEDNPDLGIRFAIMSFDLPGKGRQRIVLAGVRADALTDRPICAAFESLAEQTAQSLMSGAGLGPIPLVRVSPHEQN